MKKIIMISMICSFILISCTSNINSYEIKNADILCKDKGGIDYYTIQSFFGFIPGDGVRCMDGSVFNIDYKIKKGE